MATGPAAQDTIGPPEKVIQLERAGHRKGCGHLVHEPMHHACWLAGNGEVQRVRLMTEGELVDHVATLQRELAEVRAQLEVSEAKDGAMMARLTHYCDLSDAQARELAEARVETEKWRAAVDVMHQANVQMLERLGIEWTPGEPFLSLVEDRLDAQARELEAARAEIERLKSAQVGWQDNSRSGPPWCTDTIHKSHGSPTSTVDRAWPVSEQEQGGESGFPAGGTHTLEARLADAERRLGVVVRVRDEAISRLTVLVEAFPGECRFDHHGFCQEHLITKPCEIEQDRRFLAALDALAQGEAAQDAGVG